MNSETHYHAPWCLAVKIITALSLILLLAVAGYGALFFSPSAPPALRLTVTVLPLVIIFATLPFMVRGFVLAPGELRVERLGWQNRYALTEVVWVKIDPEALRGSIRLWGSGGLFGFFGIFRNRQLGVYRAYGTDPKRAVIVKLNQRTIVVTPEHPERFVAELETLRAPGSP
jgi:hypothetical protein